MSETSQFRPKPMSDVQFGLPKIPKLVKQVRIYSPSAAVVFKQLGFNVKMQNENCFVVSYEPVS